MNVFSLLRLLRLRLRRAAPGRRHGDMSATLRTAVLAMAAVLIPSAYARLAAGQELEITEYQLKAAFLYNFAKFVDWPQEAFDDPTTPFRLCVIGGEPFAGAQQTLAGKSVKGRSVEVRRVAGVTEARGCHMLFVGAHNHDNSAQVPALDGIGRYTLTVGETSGFTSRGGVINLTRVDDRIRFEIDRAAGERSGFRFSSQLLKLAILVGGRP